MLLPAAARANNGGGLAPAEGELVPIFARCRYTLRRARSVSRGHVKMTDQLR